MKGLILLFSLVVIVSSLPKCRFAPSFDPKKILNDKETQNRLIEAITYWEGHFHQDGVGIDLKSGLTSDGHPILQSSGELYGQFHNFSAASKESIHIHLLTLALDGDKYAKNFVNYKNPSEANKVAVEILTNKIRSYENWNQKYPGFGGFLPWFAISNEGPVMLNGWTDRVPGLDNGQLVWSIHALIPALRSAGASDLAKRWNRQLDMMKSNVLRVFYQGNGHIRAVTKIKDVTLPPSQNTYTVVPGGDTTFLDDPYEGELMAWFSDLYGNWSNSNEREMIWINKRPKIQPVEYVSSKGNITVQRGYWFSAHEQWKTMVLPYYSVPIAKRVYTNCERARTVHSAENKIPGLYASINDVSRDQNIPGYVSDAGIERIAFQKVGRRDVITPYGAMTTFLANKGVGLVWYHHMLMGNRMQGPYGSTEAINVDGTLISPLTTWDSKITSLNGMLNGIPKIIEKQLKRENLYNRFYTVLNRELSTKFTKLNGESIPFGLPTVKIPTSGSNFPSCS